MAGRKIAFPILATKIMPPRPLPGTGTGSLARRKRFGDGGIRRLSQRTGSAYKTRAVTIDAVAAQGSAPAGSPMPGCFSIAQIGTDLDLLPEVPASRLVGDIAAGLKLLRLQPHGTFQARRTCHPGLA